MELRIERSGERRRKLRDFLLCASLSMFLACALVAPASSRTEAVDLKSLERVAFDVEVGRPNAGRRMPAATAHRRGLLGSSPPRCVHRCGMCSPCQAVHVPYIPGTPTVDEYYYYPEAWRCQCGNRLFMP